MISPNPYERSQRSRRRSSLLLPALFILLVVLVCGAVIVWQNRLAGFFWHVSAPVMSLRNNLESSDASVLRAELASTTAALADRDALYQQNIALKAMLDRPQTSKRLLGAVLQRPPGLPYDTLVLDVGTRNGVVEGDLVFAGGTLAIGEVSSVYGDTSRVSLFSAPGRTYDAQVAPKAAIGTVIPLSLTGQGAGSLSGEVPAGSVAAVGDPVVIPGLGNELLGSITHIQVSAGSSFETLYVQLPVNVFSLQYVQVQTHF